MHYPIKKLAETIEMSFDIPPEEKKIAEEAKEYFEDTSHLLGLAVQHLSVIYDPFTKHTDVPVDSVGQDP